MMNLPFLTIRYHYLNNLYNRREYLKEQRTLREGSGLIGRSGIRYNLSIRFREGGAKRNQSVWKGSNVDGASSGKEGSVRGMKDSWFREGKPGLSSGFGFALTWA